MNSQVDPSSSHSLSDEGALQKDFDWIDTFHLGVFIADSSWKLLHWNANLLALLEFKTQDALAKQDVFRVLGLADVKPEFDTNQLFFTCLTLPGKSRNLDLRICKVNYNNDSYSLGIISEHPISMHDAEWNHRFQYHLMKIHQDQILESRLEGLIHNVNTPLNTILGYVQILLRENPNSKALIKIKESGFQIDASLKSVQDKIVNNRSRFPHYININQVILNELEIGKNNLFFKHNVQLELKLSENLPPVNLGYGDMSYCIDAILWNAIDSMTDTELKELSIETNLLNGSIQIIFTDTGTGIQAKDMPFIYEYGYSTIKEGESRHLGLGLSFTRQLLLDYQGTIIIESKFQVGTKVIITLPVEELL